MFTGSTERTNGDTETSAHMHGLPSFHGITSQSLGINPSLSRSRILDICTLLTVHATCRTHGLPFVDDAFALSSSTGITWSVLLISPSLLLVYWDCRGLGG